MGHHAGGQDFEPNPEKRPEQNGSLATASAWPLFLRCFRQRYL